MKNKIKINFYALLKLTISFLLLYFLMYKVDLKNSLYILKNINIFYISLALLALGTSHLMCGIRSFFVSIAVNAKLSLRNNLKFLFIGQFFNQILPSSLGGDISRVLLSIKKNVPTSKALSIVISDRLIGLLVSFSIPYTTYVLISESSKFNFYITYKSSQIMAWFALASLISLYLFKKINIKKYKLMIYINQIMLDLSNILFVSNQKFLIILFSFLIQITNVIVFYLIATSLNIGLPITYGFIIIPMILFVSALPISLAGWGIRENAMITGLSFISINSESALSISIAFGLLQLITGLPGLYLWLRHDL
jgi:uncharacterized protein (TIRG00374 family)